MRILCVRFKNLNSLVGEWEIDLSHPAYTADGIFAITGSTGAGKSTILDALCLALYGRTPRLNKVTKSGNEIMSRQTGECFAEVVFETQSGRYRCHWSQHRARKKPGGELQAPKHEIANADTGQLFETKMRGVAEQIEIATGMDFDRFTRSMLLAQGGFAAFLQAAPDDRAPILEQITGTEIYSRISIRVHETRTDQRKKLDNLQAALAGMQTLTEEEEQQLKTGLEQMSLQETELNQRITQKNLACAWLDGIELIEKDLALLDAQKHDMLARLAAFKPESDKLERAQQALELAGEYAELNARRREQEADGQSHSLCIQALPEQEARVQQAKQALKLTEENLIQKKTEQKQVLPVIRQVRELDLKLSEKQAPLQATKHGIAELEKTLDGVRAKHHETCRDLDAKKTTLNEVLQFLAANQADEGLIEQLAGIRSRFDALRELDGKHRDKAVELGAAETQQTEAIRLWDELSARLQTQKKELEAIQDRFYRQQNELKTSLAGQEIADWRNAVSALKERKTALEKLDVSVQVVTETRQILSELQHRDKTLAVEKAGLSLQIQQQTEKHAGFEREMQLLEKQLSLLKKIQGFEEARHQLQDGEACPLCGALEHPYAPGNVPAPDETMLALDGVRAALKQTNATLSELKIKQAENSKDLEQSAVRQQECADKIASENARIQQGLAVFSLDAADLNLKTVLQRLQQENNDKLATTEQAVQIIEAREKAINALRSSLEKTRETVDHSERDAQTAMHNKNSAELAVERIKKELELHAAQLLKAQDQALRDIAPYGFINPATERLDQIQLELSERREQWLARQQQKTGLEKYISTLGLQTQHQAGQISLSETELKNLQDTFSILKHERDGLTQGRQALFGDKNPDDEESRLSAAIETAEKHLEDLRLALNAAAQQLATLSSQVKSIAKAMTARAETIKSQEQAFCERLGALGFSDETAYQAACLPDDQRKQLLQQARQLTVEQTALDARTRDKTALLESERQKQITDQPRDRLALVLTELISRLKDLQQQVGGIRQKLTDNDSLRLKQQERANAIDAQKRECLRWDRLHELIGSSDGKKYRNFAQGLTFEMMIGHANRQLQKMTDRYLLMRDDGQPLELNVVDNYQAGEIRSTKNLSGGESFIVSLALALGLSHMASRNVRIDSLFLDEGFGTLDEEALDTALETLAGLQQEGKLIGVISHVPMLKERIGTQIQVSPQTGGRSVISGPGCGRAKQSFGAST